MRRARTTAFVVAISLLGAEQAFSQLNRSSAVDTQTRARMLQRTPGYSGAADRGRPGTTYSENRYGGMRTRSQRINDILEATFPQQRGKGRRRGPTGLPVPFVQQLLESRNQLTVRSKLAENSLASMSRIGYFKENGLGTGDTEEEPMLVSFSTATTQETEGMPFSDRMSMRINSRADKYFELAAGYFREQDLLRAKSYLNLVREVDRDSPRGYLADVIVAYTSADIYRAYNSLLLGVNRCKTADDLTIDRAAFFKTVSDFRAVYDSSTLLARNHPEQTTPRMLMAYFAWLAKDTAVAISTLEPLAETAATPEARSTAQKFLDLIRTAPATSAIPAAGTK